MSSATTTTGNDELLKKEVETEISEDLKSLKIDSKVQSNSKINSRGFYESTVIFRLTMSVRELSSFFARGKKPQTLVLRLPTDGLYFEAPGVTERSKFHSHGNISLLSKKNSFPYDFVVKMGENLNNNNKIPLQSQEYDFVVQSFEKKNYGNDGPYIAVVTNDIHESAVESVDEFPAYFWAPGLFCNNFAKKLKILNLYEELEVKIAFAPHFDTASVMPFDEVEFEHNGDDDYQLQLTFIVEYLPHYPVYKETIYS